MRYNEILLEYRIQNSAMFLSWINAKGWNGLWLIREYASEIDDLEKN